MPTVLLLGAGHAHLEVIRQAARLRRSGAEVEVIAPAEFWYSGLATSVVAGRVEPGDNRIDVGALCRRHGVLFHEGEVAGADPARRRVRLVDGREFSYDLLSVNLGSAVASAAPGLDALATPSRPIPPLLALGDRLASGGDRQPVEVVVVGGGPTGCEIATALARRAGAGARISLVAPPPLLAAFSGRARRTMERALGEAGIRLVSASVESATPGELCLSSGEKLPFDAVVTASGLIPAPAVAHLGLPLNAEGALRVDATLRVPGWPEVFGAGDAVQIDGAHYPRAGVLSVRQAPVLIHNLSAVLTGSPLRSFALRRPILLIMALADGTALLTFGPFALRSRWALRWKDRLDRGWLARYRPADSAPADGSGQTRVSPS